MLIQDSIGYALADGKSFGCGVKSCCRTEELFGGRQHDLVIKLKDYARDGNLKLSCWATEKQFYDEMGLDRHHWLKQEISGLNIEDMECVLDTLTGMLTGMVSSYSDKDSMLVMEWKDSGIVWMVKPEVLREDGAVYIGEANALQLRYVVADIVSSIGYYCCSELADYASGEAISAIGQLTLA